MFDFYISTASSMLHFITRRTGLRDFYFALLPVRLRFLLLHLRALMKIIKMIIEIFPSLSNKFQNTTVKCDHSLGLVLRWPTNHPKVEVEPDPGTML